MPPSGAVFGKPSEIVSVKPFRKNSMPSVVMNDGTPVDDGHDAVDETDDTGARAGRARRRRAVAARPRCRST